MALIAVPLIGRLQCIPVDLARGRYLTPFRRGLSVLKGGGMCSSSPKDPPSRPTRDQISPFRCGSSCSATYRQHTGRTLPVYHSRLDTQPHVAIGEPIIATEIVKTRHSAISHCPLLRTCDGPARSCNLSAAVAGP